MNTHQLRYLRVLYRHVAGPLQGLATDPIVVHQLKAVAGVLARLSVNLANEPYAIERLRAVARDHLPQLQTLASDRETRLEIERLQALLTHEDVSYPKVESAVAGILRRLGTCGEAALTLLKPFVEADGAIWKKIEEDQAALLAEPPMAAEQALGCALFGREASLARWLGEQPGQAPELTVEDLVVVPGGFSKQTIFATLRNAKDMPDHIVLRLDRPESPLETSVVAEYPLLEVLYKAGVRVPQPLALDRGSISGAPMIAVARLPGRVIADGQRFFEHGLPFSYAESLAAQMAAYHAIPLEKLPAELPGREHSNREAMEAELQRFRSIWDACGHQSIAVEAAFQWLSANLAWAGDARGLVHGDMRFHNVLVHEGYVSALLDWEIASVGNPALDLGYVYQHVVQLGDWQAFLKAYESAGGVIPHPKTLDFYSLRTELFVSVYLTRMAAGFQSGAFEKIELGYAAIELRQHALYLLSQRLESCLSSR